MSWNRSDLFDAKTAGHMKMSTGMMKLGVSALALMAAAGTALAGGSLKDEAEAPKHEHTLTGNVAGTTNYVFRGFSQSAEKWAPQAGVDFTYKWFYAGVWGSGIDFGNDGTRDIAHVEMDWYLGIKPVVGKFTFDFGAIYYTYPRARDGGNFANREFDYVELKAGVSVEAWKDATIGFTAFYSPTYTNDTGNVTTLEGSFSQVLPAVHSVTPTFSAVIGHQIGDDIRYRTLVGNGADNYTYWNAGITLGFGDRFSVDLRYWDTNVKSNNAAAGFADGFCTGRTFQCDSSFSATAKVTF